MLQSVNVQFNDDLADGSHCLLIELEEDVLKKLEGSFSDTPELFIKGDENEDVVFCTKKQTFIAKKVSTSNLLLLCKITGEKIDVIAGLDSHLELCMINPSPRDLQSKLSETPLYNGDNTTSLGISYDTLLTIYHGSEKELLNNLKLIGALHIGNRWTMVDKNYAHKLLCFLIASIEAESRPLDHVPLSVIARGIKSYDSLDNMLYWITVNFFDEVSDGIYSLSYIRYAKFVAEVILIKNKDNGIELENFLEEWRNKVNVNFDLNMDLLKNLCFVDEEVVPTNNNRFTLKLKIVHYCPKHLLPTDHKKRLDFLFSLRDKWPQHEFLSFVDDFVTDSKLLHKFLSKYTRTCNLNDTTFYTKKYIGF